MNTLRIGIALAMAGFASVGIQNSQRRSIFVEVPLTGLRTASDYRLTIDGAAVPILGVVAGPQSLSTVVLLDVSGSIGALDTSEIAKRTASVAMPGDAIRLGTFADSILFSTKTIRDAASSGLAAKEVSQSGGTSRLWDGLYEATRLIGRESGFRALVVFTDAMATGNERGFREVSEYITASGTVVCVVAVADSAWSPALGASMTDRSKRVREIADLTGGTYAEIRQRPFKPADAIVKMIGELRLRERLEFDFPVHSGKWHDVTLVLKGETLPAPRRLRF